MDRRRFLKEASLWTACAAIPVFTIDMEAIAAESTPAAVSIAKGTDWTKLVEKVLAPLGGMSAFVKSGAKVAIKPNISFDRTPEQASNTHPAIVKAVVEQCLKAGASKVTVFDNTLNEKRRCYQNSGIEPAMKTISDKRLNLLYLEDTDYKPMKINTGLIFKEWLFNRHVLEADVYINLPVAKHHGSAVLSLGLKNVLGIIGGNRGKIHQNLAQGIADLNTVVRPALTIIDGTRILLRHGPSGGDLADVAVKNTVIASTDTVAADSIGVQTLFNMKPSDIPHIAAASKLRLGEMDLAKIKVLNG